MASSKLKLHGFNNLTKSLSFNIYDFGWTDTPERRQHWLQRMDERYDAAALRGLLVGVSDLIGTQILNIAEQDYDPHGASVTVMVAEEPLIDAGIDAGHAMVGHLDKSHLTVHTYPETHPARDISTFRADIDVATCGLVSPLKALDFLFGQFQSGIVVMDYRVRGFTRDQQGDRHYIDHEITTIRDFISARIQSRYDCQDHNLAQHNIFHTRMKRIDLSTDDCLAYGDGGKPRKQDSAHINRAVAREMEAIYQGLR